MKNKGTIQFLLPEYNTILQKREQGDRKVRKKGMRREKGGFVSHVATTCLLSTPPPTLFPNFLMSLVSRSLVTTAITIITADQMQYNRQHFNLCYQSFYVFSFYCFLHCLLLLSSFHLQIVFLSICVPMNILKCFICNSSVSLQKDPFPQAPPLPGCFRLL